ARLNAVVVLIHQVIDPSPRPKSRQDTAPRFSFGQIYRDLASEVTSGHLPLESNYSAAASSVASAEHDRFRAEQIGYSFRIDISHRQAGPVDRDISQQRVSNSFVKSLCCRRTVVGERDVLDFAAALLCHLVKQEAIDRTSDSEREDP